MVVYLPLALAFRVVTIILGVLVALRLMRSWYKMCMKTYTKQMEDSDKMTDIKRAILRENYWWKKFFGTILIIVFISMSQYYLHKPYECGIKVVDTLCLYKTTNVFGATYRYHIETPEQVLEQNICNNDSRYINKVYHQYKDHQFDILYAKHFSDVDINDVYYKVNLNVKMEN